MRIVILTLAAVLSGCLADVPSDPPADAAAVAANTTTLVEPVVSEFRGHMTASQLGVIAHQNPQLEMMAGDVQREGFILEVITVPSVIRVDLSWESMSPGSSMLSMVNVPTSTDGRVLDILSERSDTGSVCMLLPMEEIQPGPLSFMAHSAGAVNLDWVMTITSWGGEVVLHPDRGHTEVERAEAEEREALPCPAE